MSEFRETPEDPHYFNVDQVVEHVKKTGAASPIAVVRRFLIGYEILPYLPAAQAAIEYEETGPELTNIQEAINFAEQVQSHRNRPEIVAILKALQLCLSSEMDLWTIQRWKQFLMSIQNAVDAKIFNLLVNAVIEACISNNTVVNTMEANISDASQSQKLKSALEISNVLTSIENRLLQWLQNVEDN